MTRVTLFAIALLAAAAASAAGALAAGAAPAPRAAASSAARLEALIAPGAACPGQAGATAPVAAQERTMLCLTNYARQRSGFHPLAVAGSLSKAAEHKADDLLRCDEFSHEACGREFTYWMKRFGYLGAGCWGAGENIAWGTGSVGSPGEIFRAWMRSTGHRENILGSYQAIGIGLRIGELEGHPDAHVWVQEFGSHQC